MFQDFFFLGGETVLGEIDISCGEFEGSFEFGDGVILFLNLCFKMNTIAAIKSPESLGFSGIFSREESQGSGGGFNQVFGQDNSIELEVFVSVHGGSG